MALEFILFFKIKTLKSGNICHSEKRFENCAKYFSKRKTGKEKDENMYFLLRLVHSTLFYLILLLFFIYELILLILIYFFTVSSFHWKLFSITTKRFFIFFFVVQKSRKSFVIGLGKAGKYFMGFFFVTNNVVNGTVGLLNFEERTVHLRTLEVGYLIILYKIQLNIVNLSSWYSL